MTRTTTVTAATAERFASALSDLMFALDALTNDELFLRYAGTVLEVYALTPDYDQSEPKIAYRFAPGVLIDNEASVAKASALKIENLNKAKLPIVTEMYCTPELLAADNAARRVTLNISAARQNWLKANSPKIGPLKNRYTEAQSARRRFRKEHAVELRRLGELQAAIAQIDNDIKRERAVLKATVARLLASHAPRDK